MNEPYPPHDPLRSSRAKLERAKAHIESLTLSITEQPEPDITVTRKGELQRDGVGVGEVIDDLRIKARDPIPWGLMIGDILTNLRASLDHIAWALADRRCRETGTTLSAQQEKRVSFPLRADPAHTPYRTGVGLFPSDLVFFPEGCWDLVESFQPYHRTQRPELELLGVLDQLVGIDKHRFVIAPERIVKLELSPTETRIVRQRLDQAQHQWLSSQTHDGDFEPRGTFDIVAYPPLRGSRGFSALELSDIHDLISDEVVSTFAEFFG